ncbi:MAG: glycosyltransferase family 4 protein [Cyclobacteriaceae bacterium]
MNTTTGPHRILMTTDAVGGVWHYALNLCRGLQAANIEIHLACMGPLPDDAQRTEAAGIRNLVLHESSYKLEWMDDPWEEIEQASLWLLYLEQEIQPELVHLNNYVFGELPWDSPCLVVGHSCVASWWADVRKEPLPPSWQTYLQRVRKGLQSADCVVSVSHFMLEKLKQHYGPFKNSQVIYNGYRKNGQQKAERREQFFSMGRIWDEGKNMRLLEQNAASLPWPVVIAGDGKPTGEPALGNLKKKVNYLGKINRREVNRQLSSSTVFVSPSLYEPFGLAALEAAIHGCALLLSDIDSYREIWGEAALYFDPADAQSLVEAANRLKEEPALVTSLSASARQRARQYTLQQTTQNYLSLYQKMHTQKTKANLSTHSYES